MGKEIKAKRRTTLVRDLRYQWYWLLRWLEYTHEEAARVRTSFLYSYQHWVRWMFFVNYEVYRKGKPARFDAWSMFVITLYSEKIGDEGFRDRFVFEPLDNWLSDGQPEETSEPSMEIINDFRPLRTHPLLALLGEDSTEIVPGLAARAPNAAERAFVSK